MTKISRCIEINVQNMEHHSSASAILKIHFTFRHKANLQLSYQYFINQVATGSPNRHFKVIVGVRLYL